MIDIVTRLRNIELPMGWNKQWEMCEEAADEIERLRKELQHSALQTNVMTNIATAPYVGADEQIEDLALELAECQHQYIALKADRDNWRIIAENLTALQDSEEWDLAIRRYEKAVRGE